MRVDRHTALSVLYLFLPIWIFLLCWVRPLWAIPTMLLTMGAVWYFIRDQGPMPDTEPPLRCWERVLLLGASIFFTWVSGIGAFVGQLSDYGKHNLLFFDLITRDWPVFYPNPHYDTPFLCYYLAYYLPTAGLAKLLAVPIEWADALSVGWGWAGVWLILRWVVRLSGPYRIWIGLGLLLLAGLEIPFRFGPMLWVEHGGNWSAWWDAFTQGKAAFYTRYGPPRYFFSDRLPQHSLAPYPLINQLQQTPQHAFGGWIATGLFLHRQRTGANPAGLLLLGVALVLWSPFISIGLAALAIVRQPALLRPRVFLNPLYAIPSVALLVVLGAYFLAHWPYQYVGFMTDGWNQPADVIVHFSYFIINYGLPVLILWWLNRNFPDVRPWWQLAAQSAIIMTLMSSIYMGIYNDFFMRTIIPAQWAFHLAVANGLARTLVAHRWTWAKRTMAAWVLIGLFMPTRLIGYAIWGLRFPTKIPRSITNAVRVRNEPDLSQLKGDSDFPEHDFAIQYLGRRDSFFYRYLLKHSATAPTAP